MWGMLKSGLGGEKESHTILVGNSKQQEDLEMYGQLLDYDEFQGYDLWVHTEFVQVAEKIYADFRMPSWQTLKRHFLTAEIQKKLLRGIEILAENDKKKGDFKQERMFGRVSRTPSANAFSELVKMDFVYYGDYAKFLRTQDAFLRLPVSVFMGEKKRARIQRKWPLGR